MSQRTRVRWSIVVMCAAALATAVAAAHAARALPTLATITAWHGCDHLAPVLEGDTLYTDLALERVDPLGSGGGIAHLRAQVQAAGERGERRAVLDWRFAAVLA